MSWSVKRTQAERNIQEQVPDKVQKSSDEPSSVTQPPESKTIINFLLLTSLIGTLIWLGRAIFLIYSERDVSAALSLIGPGLSVLGVSLFISIAINAFRSHATTYFALISDVLRGTSIVLGTVIWLGIGFVFHSVTHDRRIDRFSNIDLAC